MERDIKNGDSILVRDGYKGELFVLDFRECYARKDEIEAEDLVVHG